MSTILPTSLLAQPFALPTTYLGGLEPLTPLAALDATAVAALTPESIAPIASTEVDFSAVAQFQSALAQSHQLLDGLQAPAADTGAAAAGTQQLSGAGRLGTVTDAAQNLVTAYNLLQTDSAAVSASAAATEAPLLNNLLQSNLLQNVIQPNPAAGPATLADIGITLQPAQSVDTGAGLTLDAQALQTAYAANPQGTVALLNQTTDTFEQLGDQFAQQLSAEAAVSPLLDAVQGNASDVATAGNSAGVVPAPGVSQDTLADLALLDAFAGSATQAQSASIASNEAAALAQLDQLDVLQQQQQLDQARDAYTTQFAALQPHDSPLGASSIQGGLGASNAAGTLGTAATAGTAGAPGTSDATGASRTRLGEQAAQELLAQQSDAEQFAARRLDSKRLNDSNTQKQQDAATQLRIVEQQQEQAASAAQTQVLNAGQAALTGQQQVQALADAAAETATENAAITAEASAANPAPADALADDAALANAQAGIGAPATPAAIAAAPAAPTPPDNGAANADPLAVNPALAAAIAAYRLGGATAPLQSRPAAPPPRPEPVQKVAPVKAVDSASDAPPS